MAKTKTKIIDVKIKNLSNRVIYTAKIKIKVGEYYHPNRLLGLAVEQAVKKNVIMNDAKLSHVDLSGLNVSGGKFINANLSNANMRGCNASDCQFVNTNLTPVNFTGAVLDGSNFYNANFFVDPIMKDISFKNVIGDGRIFRSINAMDWDIVYTKTHMAIGCKQYKLSEWWKFTDKEIKAMHNDARRFWKYAKPILQEIIKRNPCRK